MREFLAGAVLLLCTLLQPVAGQASLQTTEQQAYIAALNQAGVDLVRAQVAQTATCLADPTPADAGHPYRRRHRPGTRGRAPGNVRRGRCEQFAPKPSVPRSRTRTESIVAGSGGAAWRAGPPPLTVAPAERPLSRSWMARAARAGV